MPPAHRDTQEGREKEEDEGMRTRLYMAATLALLSPDLPISQTRSPSPPRPSKPPMNGKREVERRLRQMARKAAKEKK